MTLIAAGDNLRNRALQGLEYMSQEEAEREALRQAMEQQKKDAARSASRSGRGTCWWLCSK